MEACNASIPYQKAASSPSYSSYDPANRPERVKVNSSNPQVPATHIGGPDGAPGCCGHLGSDPVSGISFSLSIMLYKNQKTEVYSRSPLTNSVPGPVNVASDLVHLLYVESG